MANNLRKFKFLRNWAQSLSSNDSPSRCSTKTPQPDDQMDVTDLKAEILASLKRDIAMLLRSELKTALAEDFENIKSELQAVKTELANNTTAIRSEVETMKTTVSHMEQGLSSCSDDVTLSLTKVGKLQTEGSNLREKCLDMEGRMRRSNIRILNVHYYQDCVDILRHARESGPLRFKGIDTSIFPDYPLSVVQARSTFSEVR